MCRLVAVVASEVTEFGLVLKEAPRSLARLSEKHPDGWGVAAHGGRDSNPPPSFSAEGADGSQQLAGWRIHKGTERASLCRRFEAIASRSAGTVLIAHVRQKTVGPTRLDNTHPFAANGWVFAHNGTIEDQSFVRAGVPAARIDGIRGDTDSEVLFAFLLARLEEAGVLEPATTEARDEATRILERATEELRARRIGAFNFVLSDGRSCYVHRFGRTLFLLERRPSDASQPRLDASWVERKHAVLVASERLTDEPWEELAEGTLLRIDRDPIPQIGYHRAE